MYYLLFPVYLVIVYSTTYLIPHYAPPPENSVMTAQQEMPAEKTPSKQAPTGENKSALMAPSEPADTKKGKGVEQQKESGVPMMAPSESVENMKGKGVEQQQELTVPMMAPSESVENMKGKGVEQQQESDVPMMAPSSEPVKNNESAGLTEDVQHEELSNETETVPVVEEKKERSTKGYVKASVFIVFLAGFLFIL